MKLRFQTLAQSAVVLVAVLAAGCGSGSSASPPTTVSRNLGCSQLSNQQLKGLLGDHITTQPHGASDCYYLVKPGTYLLVSAGPTSSAAYSLSYLIDHYGGDPGSSVLRVAGQTALWITYPAATGGGGRLQAVDGPDLIELTMTAGGPDPKTTAVQAMTAIINSRSGS